MKLPTKEEALALLKKYHMKPNIMAHTLVVNKIANYLAKKLKSSGEKIDLDVIDRASMLHDIAKSKYIDAHKPSPEDEHHIEGEKIMIKEGYPELGRVVRLHSIKEMKNLRDWEEKVIKYSDSRVRHTEIVSLRERLDDLNKRYNVPKEKRVPEHLLFALEKEIYDKIGGTPENLEEDIQ